MPNGALKSKLNALAQSFADSVLDAIRTASLDELVDRDSGTARPRRTGRATAGPTPTADGRLARRTAEDIATLLGRVVAALKAGPMRAEQIRDLLKLDKRELPRVLHEGLQTKKLKRRGQKRATMYSVR
ncbi:MAG TPA: hypothetical protein VGG39_37600 [Polyangiaceae bacterium]|jgi:hypothetical protein